MHAVVRLSSIQPQGCLKICSGIWTKHILILGTIRLPLKGIESFSLFDEEIRDKSAKNWSLPVPKYEPSERTAIDVKFKNWDRLQVTWADKQGIKCEKYFSTFLL